MAQDQDRGASPQSGAGPASSGPGSQATSDSSTLAAPRSTPTGDSEPPGGTAPADPAAWLIALATFAAYTAISVLRYVRLAPGSWDLGIYTEYVRQLALLRAPVVAIRGAGFNLLGDHFQPIVGLLAPFFRVFPTPVTLLVGQALLTAVSVVPVCRAAQVLLGTGVSRAIGVAYGFSWGLQQMINFDFHEIAFAVPLLAFSLSALVRGRLRAAALWALPLVFVKEDQGFTVAAIGLAIAVLAARSGAPSARREGIWAGSLLACWGLAWSVLAIAVIIPHFNPVHHYQYWSDGGVIGPGGSRFSWGGLLAQLEHAGARKLRTTVMIVLPVAFLALQSPLVLIALPSLALRFESTNRYFWGTAWHYNATVMPIVFLAAVAALARHRAWVWLPRYAAVAMLAIAAWLVTSFPLSQLWHARTYRTTGPHIRAEDEAMALVPPGTTVEATLSMLAPLAARDQAFWVGSPGDPAPRYVVFDAASSGWSPAPADIPAFVDQRHPGFIYQRIFQSDDVYVFRRAMRTGG